MTKGNLNNLDKSFVQNLSNNWALVTSGASDNYNMMTVNWGGIGFLWNKPVLFIFIRPERYTFEFFCFRPVVPANERTGTKDPLCGSSIN